MIDRLRVGAVSYLNSKPLVRGLERGLGVERVELSLATPAVLADRMAAARLDIALLPVVELARLPELEIVPGLGIVTRGASRSVLLVGREPLETLESVALDPESRTTNALVRVLFAEIWGHRPVFRKASAVLSEALAVCTAAVRIGDKALIEPVPSGCWAIDLAEAWTRATELPFVFAVWAARPGLVDPEIQAILQESCLEGCRNIGAIADEFTWHGVGHAAIAREYLTEYIHFCLGPHELQALARFFQSAHAVGAIPHVPEIRLLARPTLAEDRAVEPATPGKEPLTWQS